MKPLETLAPAGSKADAGDAGLDLPCVTTVWVVTSEDRPLSGAWSIRLRDCAGRVVVRTEPFGATSNPDPRPPVRPAAKLASPRRRRRRHEPSLAAAS